MISLSLPESNKIISPLVAPYSVLIAVVNVFWSFWKLMFRESAIGLLLHLNTVVSVFWSFWKLMFFANNRHPT